MARPALIAKLARELCDPIATERQVVYILVELRKLMEQNGDAAGYFALNFYCDWAVHTKLDRLGATRIVERFDRYQGLLELSQSTPEGSTTEGHLDVLKEVEDTVRLDKFREQLGQYLRQNGLSDAVAGNECQWVNFLSYYVRVIEDCPLICRKELPHVGAVAVSVIETKEGKEAQDAGYRVKLAWQWEPRQSPIVVRHISVF